MWLEFLLFCVLLLVYAVVRDRRPRNCPPGPFEIPFIGGLPIFEERTPEKYRKKYGDIVMYRNPMGRVITLFDPNTAKEVLSRPDFADRPAFFADFASMDDQKLGGVIFSNGVHWQHDRRFVLRNLRNLGMGRSYLGDAINIEANALVEDLKKYNGEAINYPDSFRTAPLNIIWQMVASTRYDLHSTEVEVIYKKSAELQTVSIWTFFPMFFPVLKLLPKFITQPIFNDNLVEGVFSEIKKIVVETIEKHMKEYDPDNPRDLIDEYVKDMKENEGNEESLFRMGALIQIVIDLFQAGSDTINTMLKWATLYLAQHPDYARRMQTQIDEVVPNDRMVSLEDKPSLPLVEAFLAEVLRCSSVVILNVERAAARDTTIGGYFVPKGTFLQTGNYSMHHDPRYWDDPQRFYPERFLDESGTKYTAPKGAFFAFGAGRRQCAGEVLARMEMFLFLAAIIQNFDVLPPEGDDLDKVGVLHLPGGIRAPADHKQIYRSRK